MTEHAGDLLFLPLGGAGEIGMNLNLYRYGGKWLMVDLGITFGDDSTPGVDVIMPDPSYIVDLKDDLLGVVLTHAHEDHLGAVPYLWPRLRCPIYATPFTAAVLRRKLQEADLEAEAEITEVPMSGTFELGPFAIELITLTHSIPEPNALVIRTPVGNVLHTGDWKLDPDPLVGPTTDEAALRRVGEEGVLAMVGDSTNVFVSGESGSEADVRESLTKLVADLPNRVAVTCFASNIARLETLSRVAEANGRHAALVGRSLTRMVTAARQTGYLKDTPLFLGEEEAGFLPRDKVLMICTGSQGERRAALSRIVEDSHPHVVLEAGDAVVFSSRIIPGNESAIGRLHNRLVERGVDVIDERDGLVHVSGHPARDELAQMYQWIRPEIAVPVHGESRHIVEHVRFAKQCQVPNAIAARNGTVIRLAPGPAEVVGEVQHGRLALDGDGLALLGATALRERKKIIWNGAAVATVVMDGKGRLAADPRVSLQGMIEAATNGEVERQAAESAREAIDALPKPKARDDETVEDAVRRSVRRAVYDMYGKRPLTTVHVVRL